MNIREISPTYSVSPQILASDMATIAQAGYKSVICNRPDAEHDPSEAMDVMSDAAQAEGLVWGANPFDAQSFDATKVEAQGALIESLPKPILAYCAVGARSAMAWAMSQAGTIPVDYILNQTRMAGYMLDHMRPTLEHLAKR